MKRRRGSKKGRPKKPKLVNTDEVAQTAVSLNTEENSGVDEFDNEDVDSGMDAETERTPSPPLVSQPETLATGRPNSTNIFGKAVYTRVKVKIKNSKTLGTSSDAPSQSDTDKSSHQVGSEKQLPSEKMEDSANSNGGISGNTTQKPTGVKIKSSRGLGSLSMSPCSNTEPLKGDRVENKDTKLLHKESKHNEQELRTALEVTSQLHQVQLVSESCSNVCYFNFLPR